MELHQVDFKKATQAMISGGLDWEDTPTCKEYVRLLTVAPANKDPYTWAAQSLLHTAAPEMMSFSQNVSQSLSLALAEDNAKPAPDRTPRTDEPSVDVSKITDPQTLLKIALNTGGTPQ